MSFHFNLSSDEDEEEKQEWLQRDSRQEYLDSKLPAVATMPSHAASSSVARAPSPSDVFVECRNEESESDDDEVDWIDACQDDVISATNHAEIPTDSTVKPVTIDLGHDRDKKMAPGESKRKRKRKARHVYRFRSLPNHLQAFLSNLHQAHLLALTSRAVYLSSLCSDYELLHVAHSLIPPQFLRDSAATTQIPPSLNEVRQFMAWYFDFVNRTSERRRHTRLVHLAAGAPGPRRKKASKQKSSSTKKYPANSMDDFTLMDVCSYLSTVNDDDPLLVEQEIVVSDRYKAMLLVCIARSLGWKARYVTALEPCTVDLDTNHPLLMDSAIGIFSILRPQGIKTTDEPSPRNKKARTEASFGSIDSSANATIFKELGWVEILSVMPSKGSRRAKTAPKCRWIPLDPAREAIDQPDLVECALSALHRDGSLSTKRRDPIRFALGVEHRPMLLSDESVINCWRKSDDDTTTWYAWNHARLTEVTRRYATSWSRTLRLRGADPKINSGREDDWWSVTLKQCNASYKARAVAVATGYEQRTLWSRGASMTDAIDIDNESSGKLPATPSLATEEAAHVIDEETELQETADQEAIPTSKTAFKNHPVYAIQSSLNSSEVLAPDAKRRMCGIFKGEIVYRRSDVSTALRARKWLYQGRKVKEDELFKPVRRVKARKRAPPKGFQALRTYGVGNGNDGSETARRRDVENGSAPVEESDGMVDLFALWQTVPWSPQPVGPNEAIPVNDFNNVELELLNPGLTHLTEPRISTVAKKLGIPYAPCLLGFEGHGSNRTPTIRGIVVHDHSVEVLREAHAEVLNQTMEQEQEDRQKTVQTRWKRLMVGVLTKDRLEREYGDG